MSRLNRRLGRTTIAGLAVGVASVVAAATAQPVGATSASAAPAAAVHPVSAAAGYWTGNQPGLLKSPFGDHFPGWLSHCGL
jgi:hypothetical protein